MPSSEMFAKGVLSIAWRRRLAYPELPRLRVQTVQPQMFPGFNGATTVTAHEFRTLALSFPATLEGAHMDHPDFRVRGKIFASLGPHEAWGMVKLTPEQQREFVREEPKIFQPFNGTWGARGCTKVHLMAAKKQTAWRALLAAWRNTAPKRLAEQLRDEF